MNPDDPLLQVRVEVAAAMLNMMKVGQQLAAHADDIDDAMALVLGTLMMLTCQYAATTMRILNQPNVEQPMLGRRCIFY